MAGKKTRVLVFSGGRSPEHDVSIITGIQAMNALDPERYETIPLYIAPNGQWLTGEALRDRTTFIPGPAQMAALTPVALHIGPGRQPQLRTVSSSLFQRPKTIEFDIALLAFHGLVGEDGRIQGLLETANIPYTGMRLTASAVLMDKTATKRMLEGTGVPQLPFHEIKRPRQGLMITPQELGPMTGGVKFPCCLKPANLGSSIGVARVENVQDVSDVLPAIFRYDDTAMLEPFVENLVEYNVAVCRVGGEIRTSAIERPKRASELLDFKTKYTGGGAKKTGTKAPGQQPSEGMLSLTRDINPDIPKTMADNIRAWAQAVFERVGGAGAPRLDFLCNGKTGEVWFNEANPCPGSFGYFLWEAAQKPLLFSELLDHLIAEAQELHARRQIPLDPTPEDARLFPRRS
jgi:D-alanine-D-alanine ligase